LRIVENNYIETKTSFEVKKLKNRKWSRRRKRMGFVSTHTHHFHSFGCDGENSSRHLSWRKRE
jgi:hypothetical protein